MTSLAAGAATFDFSTDPAPTRKIDDAQVDTQIGLLWARSNAMLAILDGFIRSDDTIKDDYVRLRMLHPEVFDFLAEDGLAASGTIGAVQLSDGDGGFTSHAGFSCSPSTGVVAPFVIQAGVLATPSIIFANSASTGLYLESGGEFGHGISVSIRGTKSFNIGGLTGESEFYGDLGVVGASPYFYQQDTDTAGGAFISQANIGSTAAFDMFTLGSARTGTTAGHARANTVGLLGYAGSLARVFIGHYGVTTAPISVLCGSTDGSETNALEAARFSGGPLATGSVQVRYTTNATNATSGALQVLGGLGVVGDVRTSGILEVKAASATGYVQNTSNTSYADLRVATVTAANNQFDIEVYGSAWPGANIAGLSCNDMVALVSRSANVARIVFGSAVSNIPLYFASNNIEIARFTSGTLATGEFKVLYTTPSTSTVTGAVTVGGGLGVAGALFVGGSSTFSTGLFGDGAAATPSISFSADTNTGMYRIGADVLGFSTGGVRRMSLDGQKLTIGDGVTATQAEIYLNAPAGNDRAIYGQSAGVNRWILLVGNATVEGGADAGSGFELKARTDAGAAIDSPLSCLRAAGGTFTCVRPWTTNSSWTQTGSTTLSTGTGANSLNGDVTIAAGKRLGIGSLPAANYLSITPSASGTTGVNQIGVSVSPAFASDATTSSIGIVSAPTTVAAAYTTAILAGYSAWRGGIILGAASSATRTAGFMAQTITVGGTANHGFYHGTGTSLTGAGNYSLYLDAALNNYLGSGATLINTTTDDTINKLQVAGGVLISRGTITTALPVLDSTVTWNAGGVTFTGIKLAVTSTASAAASLLADLQVGAVSQFSVGKAGQVTHRDTTLLHTTVALTNGAGASVGTLTNAPAATNPTKWIPIDDNGTTRYVPAW